jgi:glucose-6-phosphate dehydrogenase assembly protein OpcA
VEEAVSPGPTAVIGRIEGELRALWAAPPAPGEVPRSRACTMNLVLVASSVDVAREWVPVVDEILQGTPARALVVGLDPDGADALEADVSGVCTPGGADALLCSERVSLVARGAVSVRLPSVVAALTVTDVPTTLVWLGRAHANDPVFAALASDATRIVLDASLGSLAGLADVVYWLRTKAPAVRPGVADLTWVRLSTWQELCSRLFDEPRLRPLADRVTNLTIVQDGSGGGVLGPQGTLLLGWLATRLGWKAASLAGKLRLVRRDGGTIAVSLRSEGGGASAGAAAVQAVRLDAGDAELSVHGEMKREGNAASWRMEIRAGSAEPQRIEQRVRLRDQSNAAILDRALHRPTHDPALEEAAAWVDELRGEELACG